MTVDDGLPRRVTRADDDVESVRAGESAPGRNRSAGIYTLAAVNLFLAALALLALRIVSGAEEFALTQSADIGSDLEATLLGLSVLRIGLYIVVGGFALASLATLSLTRIGWIIQIFWATAVGLTLAGIPYGVPVLAYMLRARTRARFLGSPLDD